MSNGDSRREAGRATGESSFSHSGGAAASLDGAPCERSEPLSLTAQRTPRCGSLCFVASSSAVAVAHFCSVNADQSTLLQSFTLLRSCGAAICRLAASILRLVPCLMFPIFPTRAIIFLFDIFGHLS
jgi:hypothetical protein